MSFDGQLYPSGHNSCIVRRNMNTGAELRSSDGPGSNVTGHGPYEASIGSSVPSSQASVFSDALSSASSSIATSISDDFRSSQEDTRDQERGCTRTQLQFHVADGIHEGTAHCGLFKPGQQCPSYADVTSVPARQRYNNPRRSSLSRAHRPPPLVRQHDRKVNFVDNLVDSATQMVEVIWPLSVVPCRAEASGRGVLPLRTYIEETLKRSRTSYSTLQVALYYLVLIRPYVPENDFTMEQTIDCPTERALMCGRRMFLAALILASKYLQDRNYSAKAWSKMSGLRVSEINANERNFLSKINWKLHIPKPAFEKWQDIVLRYSPNHPPSPSWNISSGTSMWKRIIPLLNADLDVPLIENKLAPGCGAFSYFDVASPATPTPASIQGTLTLRPIDSTSQETTPTPATVLPRYLEPSPNALPPMPTLARMGPLPTPTLTPQSASFNNTPAVSVCSSRQSSMSSAMTSAQRKAQDRYLLDTTDFERRTTHARRPSIGSANSYDSSSPESIMSDHSRSSRASSISSVSTVSTSSSLAPRACLARQATCRNAGLLHTRTIKEEPGESVTKPIVIDDDTDMSSPMMADFSVSEKVLHAPHRHSRGPKHTLQPPTAPATDKSKKRGRSHGHRRSELQEEVRYLLEESLDDDEMEMDDRLSPAPLSSCTSNMSRGPNIVSFRDVQPPATLGGWDYGRLPVQQSDGRKRRCAMSTSPGPLYGEVV